MPENCNPNDCPVSIRVEALQDEFNRYRGSSSSTHKEIFQRLGDLEKSEAAQEQHFATVNEKLDKLIAWQEESREKVAKQEDMDAVDSRVKDLESKPGKRWDSFVAAIIASIAGALAGFLLRGWGM